MYDGSWDMDPGSDERSSDTEEHKPHRTHDTCEIGTNIYDNSMNSNGLIHRLQVAQNGIILHCLDMSFDIVKYPIMNHMELLLDLRNVIYC